jgi:hypothetical protein
MSSLKATGARKYPSRLDLLDEDLPSSPRSDSLIKPPLSPNESRNQHIEADRGAKVSEGAGINLVEGVVDKLASTFQSTLFPQAPEPRYVLRNHSEDEEGLYLL